MTDYVLDTSRWRSGEKSAKNKTGSGVTAMYNKEGFMCCLGQFAQQKGINLPELRTVADPAELAIEIGYIYDENFVENGDTRSYELTELSRELLNINDDFSITPEKRMQVIKETLEEYGHTLTITN